MDAKAGDWENTSTGAHENECPKDDTVMCFLLVSWAIAPLNGNICIEFLQECMGVCRESKFCSIVCKLLFILLWLYVLIYCNTTHSQKVLDEFFQVNFEKSQTGLLH